MGFGTEQGGNLNIGFGFVWLGISLIWYMAIRAFNMKEDSKDEKYVK